MEDMLGGGRQEEAAEEEGVSVSFSDAGMQAMISAGSALGQAKVQGSVAKSLKGRAGILKTEIEQDASRGSSAEKKREELADESVSGAENISKDETDSALSMAERYNPIDIVL